MVLAEGGSLSKASKRSFDRPGVRAEAEGVAWLFVGDRSCA
jgi:hypothetical protein